MSDKRAPAESSESKLRSGSYEPKRSGGSAGGIEAQPVEEADHTRARRERMERRAAEREAREIELKKKEQAEGIRTVRTRSVPLALIGEQKQKVMILRKTIVKLSHQMPSF